MRVYVAGPMRGLPEFNFPAFDKAALDLTVQGHDVVNPAEHDREGGFDPAGMTGNEDLAAQGFDLRAALAWDLEQITRCDAVFLLDGWQQSSGARAEYALAQALGLQVASEQSWREADPTWDRAWLFEQSGFGLTPPTLAHAPNPAAATAEAPAADPTTGEVRAVSTTGGEKGTKPERFDLLPNEALATVARHYGAGARKYAAHNWRRGYPWSQSYAALQRHANAFWSGEDTDAETGSPHMAAVAFHALTLLTFMVEQPGFDDRYKPQPPKAVGGVVRAGGNVLGESNACFVDLAGDAA
ncbi:dATP/dGTP diphosphohydrolase domain-containing protein [Cellulosimicrobium funkei]|uniref:dATP/dGTP diphosphohydrolase domain-containing protein n=1 Tax=Cellulosimicrobium funkei TaxID=264251 RepID=UPI003435E9B9